MPEPTPGPWVAVLEEGTGMDAPNWEIRAASGATIGVFYGDPHQDWANAEEDARLVVEAVNAYAPEKRSLAVRNMRIPAATRDGDKCDDCGGPVEYVAARALWEHTAQRVECPKGLRLYEVLGRYDTRYLAPPQGIDANAKTE